MKTTMLMPAATLLLSIFLTVVNAFAESEGNSNGGGGLAVVCRDTSDRTRILSAQLLEITDLELRRTFRARFRDRDIPSAWGDLSLWALSRVKPNGDVDQDQKLLEDFLLEFFTSKEIAEYVSAQARWLLLFDALMLKEKIEASLKSQEMQGVAIIAPMDSGLDAPALVPSGCGVENVAFYGGSSFDSRIWINSDIWRNFSITDRAALILHESIYRAGRTLLLEKSSFLTRDTVARLFTLFANPRAPRIAVAQKISDNKVFLELSCKVPRLQTFLGRTYDFIFMVDKETGLEMSSISRNPLINAPPTKWKIERDVEMVCADDGSFGPCVHQSEEAIQLNHVIKKEQNFLGEDGVRYVSGSGKITIKIKPKDPKPEFTQIGPWANFWERIQMITKDNTIFQATIGEDSGCKTIQLFQPLFAGEPVAWDLYRIP